MFTENFLCVCGADDDIGDGWSDADFDSRVSLFSQFPLKEFVEFGKENTVYSPECQLFFQIPFPAT